MKKLKKRTNQLKLKKSVCVSIIVNCKIGIVHLNENAL